jgi:hypothetical protein
VGSNIDKLCSDSGYYLINHLGLLYQVRDKRSRPRHLILVFCAYTFILWHTLTGGLRRRWENKPLNTFTDALEAFRTAIYFWFVCCG